MNQRYILILAGIVFLGAFLRLWQLDKLPPGLYPDEAIYANDGLKNPGKVFYPENNGREGLYPNLLYLSFAIFGTSILALRLVPALIGILTILGIYFLAKEIAFYIKNKNTQYLPLLSAFFLATSFWHINFSRIGFRAILVPLILTFCFYFLLKGFKAKTLSNIIIAGIFFGLGFYSYISFRVAILLLPFIFIPFLIFYKSEGALKQFWLFLLWFVASAILISLPIGIYFITHPQDFISRALGISVFAQPKPLTALVESFIKHLGMFNIKGDPNWRHNLPETPMLFWPVGIFFMVGLIIAIKNSLKASGSDLFGNFIYLFLVGWFLTMLLPGVLTYEGIPHALRTIGTIPAVIIMAAFGAIGLYNFFEKFSLPKFLIKGALALILASIALGGYYQYFVLWGQKDEVKGAFTQNFVKMGQYLNSLAPGVKKYVIVNENGVPVPFPDGIPMPAQTLIFIENTSQKPSQQKAIYLKPEQLDKIEPHNRTIILPMREDPEIFAKLLSLFPQGKIERPNGFLVYVIER